MLMLNRYPLDWGSSLGKRSGDSTMRTSAVLEVLLRGQGLTGDSLFVTLYELIEEVRLFYAQRSFNAALDAIEAYVASGNQLPDSLLVVRGKLIQLSGRPRLTLKDAEQSFSTALSLNPKNVEAKAELAWLYVNVFNQPQKAKPLFAEALASLLSRVSEVQDGLSKCDQDILGEQADGDRGPVGL